MCDLSKYITVVETIPYIPGEYTKKKYLPKVRNIADDYNNPFYDSVNSQVVICVKSLEKLGGAYV